MANEKKKLVAISTLGHKVALIKNVTDNEYNELLNQQSKEQRTKELLEKANNEWKNRVELHKKHVATLELILAKSVYDNFVIRGILNDNEQFEKLWYDFYFNGKELDLENAPQEYKDILTKVGNL